MGMSQTRSNIFSEEKCPSCETFFITVLHLANTMVKYGSLAHIVMVASFFNFCSQLGDNKEKFIDIQLYFSSSFPLSNKIKISILPSNFTAETAAAAF